MAEEFTVRGIGGKSTMNRSAYDDYQQSLASRRAVGRYTLEEAALTLSDETGESAAPMLKKLMQAVRDGVLPVYAPGKNARYMYGDGFVSVVRDFYEEAYWCDLNKWLADNDSRIAYEFAAPETETPPVSPAAVLSVLPAEPVTPETQAAPASGPVWKLKIPKRYQGYGKPLYDVMKAAHAAGLPCPTARDVLDAFKRNKPPEIISVMPDSMDYLNGKGGKVTAELESIRKAIGRLVIR